MRDVYQEQLDQLADSLAGMCAQVAEAMEKATRALLDVDLQLAEEVISADVRVDEIRAVAEEQAFGLLALQAPVATDLRIVVSAIHGASDIERMGDLALHVAQAARRRHPQPVLPSEVAPYFAEMGQVAVRLATKAGDVIRTRDLARAVDGGDDGAQVGGDRGLQCEQGERLLLGVGAQLVDPDVGGDDLLGELQVALQERPGRLGHGLGDLVAHVGQLVGQPVELFLVGVTHASRLVRALPSGIVPR